MPSGMGGVSVFQEVFGLTRLGETLRAYQARDPAARSRLEIFLLYPGVHALIYPRSSTTGLPTFSTGTGSSSWPGW